MSSTRDRYFCPVQMPSEQPSNWQRYGLPWTEEEHHAVKAYFRMGRSLSDICLCMQRPPAGVVAKLVMYRLIEPFNGHYYTVETTEKEIQMNPDSIKTSTSADYPTIENKTFICGIDAAGMTDDQIFRKIASLENEIAKLDQIKTKPKKLVAKIDAMRADVQKLVDYVDAR